MEKGKCLSCKQLFSLDALMKFFRNKNGSQYYMCRPCNTERARIYRNTLTGRTKTRNAVYKSIAKYPHKQSARMKVSWAVKSGKLLKPVVCSHCNGKKKLEAHHNDYSKPLEVVWVCRPCHSML